MRFIQDLPAFLVLLLALDRFEVEDWGLNPLVDPGGVERQYHGTLSPNANLSITLDVPTHSLSTVTIGSETVKVKVDETFIHRPYVFLGRGTQVYPVSVVGHPELHAIAKISWIEDVRDSEVEVLAKAWEVAREVAREDATVRGHIPEVIAFRDYPQFATGKIRKSLEIVPETGSRRTTSRVLRVTIFLRLDPLTSLVGEAFLRAFFDCFQCMFLLHSMLFPF